MLAPRFTVVVLALLTLLAAAKAEDLRIGDADPAKLSPPPADALGWPSRDSTLDALPGFKKPPPGYGPIAGWWWSGPDRLTKDRIAYQLDEMKKLGFMGLQVCYSHLEDCITPDVGEPKLFSEEWWKLFQWTVEEGRKRGMAIGLCDYNWGNCNGDWGEELRGGDPEMLGVALITRPRMSPAGPPSKPLCRRCY